MAKTSLSVIAEVARRMKGEKVRLYGDDPDEELSDLMSFVGCFRGGHQVFVAYVGPGPYAARQCAYHCALLTRCDEYFLVADARFREFPSTPETVGMSAEEAERYYIEKGEHWAGKLGEDWQAGNRDGIRECLAISRYAILGPATMAHYNYIREGTKLTWTHVAQIPPEEHSGAIDDYINAGILKRKEIGPEIEHKMEQDAARSGLSYEEAAYHEDRAMAKVLSRQPGVFVVSYTGQVDRTYSFSEGKEIAPEDL